MELKEKIFSIQSCDELKIDADKIYLSLVNEICNNILIKLKVNVYNYEPFLHITDQDKVFDCPRLQQNNDSILFGENGFIVNLVISKLQEKGYTCLSRENNDSQISKSYHLLSPVDWYICIYDCKSFCDRENHIYKNMNILY